MQPDLLARFDQRVPRYTSYPTAPHFSAAVGPDTYAGWLAELPEGAATSLYLHVPFCAELCLYCGCHTAVSRRYGPVAAYAALIEREIDLVADAMAPPRVERVHWGGGTPTILRPAEFGRLSKRLRERFGFSAAETSVEIDPRTADEAVVAMLADNGVGRASLGVQTFDAVVQQAINRIQPFEQTQQVVAWLRRAGINRINFDLMYGLPHQTVANVADSVERALTLGPDRIALFGYAHVPWMKRHQALLPEAALPGATERLAQAEAAAERIQAAGYVAIGIDHFARPADDLARAAASGRLRRNFQGYTTDDAPVLIGFGTSAIGSLPQGYVQNAASTVAYREAIIAGRLATARGIALSGEDRLRRDIIERLMCDFRVDLAAICEAHDTAPAELAPALARLEDLAAEGLARRNGWTIEVPEDARMLVRTVCAAFDARWSPEATQHSRAV